MYITHRLHDEWLDGDKMTVVRELCGLQPTSEAVRVAVELSKFLSSKDRELLSTMVDEYAKTL